MGEYAAAIPIVLAGATAGYQYVQGQKAAEAAEEVGAANAAAAAAETAEAARRLRRQQDITLAEQRARAAASGVQSTGSQLAWLEDEAGEAGAEMDWLKKAGLSQQQLAYLSGKQASGAASAAGTGAALGTLGGGVNSAFNWYQALA